MTRKDERRRPYDKSTAQGLAGSQPTAVQMLISRAVGEEERAQERSTPLHPHERARVSRRLAISFPSEAWVEAVRESAARAGLSVSEYLIFCFAHVQAAGIAPPRRGAAGFHDRAGQNLRLPWEPEEKERDR